MGKKTDKTDRVAPYPPPNQPPRQSVRQALITSRQDIEPMAQGTETMTVINLPVEPVETVPSPIPSTSQQQVALPHSQVLDQPSTSQGVSGGSINQVSQINDNQNLVCNEPCIPSIHEFREMQNNMASMSSTIVQLQKTLEKFNPPAGNDQNRVENNSLIGNTVQGNMVNQQVHANRQPINNQVEHMGAEHAVGLIVDQHIDNMVDEAMGTGEIGTIAQVGRPLDLKVSDNLKQKIWANQYIDLNLLLDTTPTVNSALEVVSGQGEPLRLAPAKTPNKIMNLGQWCDAFLVFLTIYSRKYPHSTPELTSYIKIVKTLCHRGGNYLLYDREFRYLRQSNGLGWELHPTLWLECRDNSAKPANNTNRQNNSKPKANFRPSNAPKSQHPSGSCYAYHNTGQCNKPGCNFRHTCYIQGCTARTPHPVFKCPTKVNNNTQSGRNNNNNNNHNNTANTN